MAGESPAFGGLGRRLRLGMVGGGQGALIGPVHRMAARLDDRYELVAGAFSSDSGKNLATAADLCLPPERAYADFAEMASREAARADGVEVVAIVTPNHLHYGPAKAFLETRVHVVCDKPLTTRLSEALDLVEAVRRTGLVFALTHAYACYPMIRQARAMVAAGELGEVRVVQVEYPQETFTDLVEDLGAAPDRWRRDPARSGAGGCIADIGTHAHHLAEYVTGLELRELCADLSTFVPGGQVDDNNHILLRYEGGARGMLWASKVAPGYRNPLRLRVFGTRAGLSWKQERPDEMTWMPLRGTARTVMRAGPDTGEAAARASRLRVGHPEGLIEAFANIYSEVADVVAARLLGRPTPRPVAFPTVEDGARGMKFIEAALDSNARGGAWVDARLAL